MKKKLNARFLAILVPTMAVIALLVSACGTAAPEQVEIPVKLTSRTLNPKTIQVGQNDTVTLKIETDEPGALHLHGYDIEKEVAPGEVTEFNFVADATGRYSIAFHPAGGSHSSEEAGHGEEFQSEVL